MAGRMPPKPMSRERLLAAMQELYGRSDPDDFWAVQQAIASGDVQLKQRSNRGRRAHSEAFHRTVWLMVRSAEMLHWKPRDRSAARKKIFADIAAADYLVHARWREGSEIAERVEGDSITKASTVRPRYYEAEKYLQRHPELRDEWAHSLEFCMMRMAEKGLCELTPDMKREIWGHLEGERLAEIIDTHIRTRIARKVQETFRSIAQRKS